MKYLVPVARISLDDCERMAAAFAQHHCDTREAGQLYAAWRDGSRSVRERLLASPELFFKTQRRAPPAETTHSAALERDLEMAAAILRRARRRLPEALPEMGPAQQHNAECQIRCLERAEKLTATFPVQIHMSHSPRKSRRLPTCATEESAKPNSFRTPDPQRVASERWFLPSQSRKSICCLRL
jgi:hypothetical protein